MCFIGVVVKVLKQNVLLTKEVVVHFKYLIVHCMRY